MVGEEAADCVYLEQVFFFFFNQNGAPENLENLYRLSYVQISQFPNNKDSMARGTLLEVALLLLLSTLDGSILHI